MQTILRKRVFRNFKTNLLRYLSLGLLIILGMYMIVSLVGAAETVITGVNKHAEKNKRENGQFSVFVPLTDSDRRILIDKGISLESMFYLDFELTDASTLRVYKNRESINLVSLDSGRLSQSDDEVVLEKRYCEEHGLAVGDDIKIGSKVFRIVGKGSVPDYDAVLKNLSDSSVDSLQFGLAFVNANGYTALKESGNNKKSEEYVYAYRRNNKMTEEELKDHIKKIEFSADDVENSYFQEYWDETAGKKEKLQDGIKKLKNGSESIDDSLDKLSRHNEDLKNNFGRIFEAYLQETSNALSVYGLTQKLTENNYKEVIETMKTNTGNVAMRLKLEAVLEQLKNLESYRNGVSEYTSGVADTAKGSDKLVDGMQELKESSDELMDEYFKVDLNNLTQFLKSFDNPRINASANDQIINKMSGLIAGIIVMILFTYVISVFVIHEIEKESSVIGTLYALGVKKKDLMFQYLMLPVLITLVAGVIGTILGFSKFGVNVQMQDCYDYFSVPILPVVYPVYLIIYGVVMPPVVAIIVNCFVIHKKLSEPALKLIRNEQKYSKISNINLGNMGFVGRFQLRQMLREARTGFTVVFGMIISLLIMMMGIDCFVLCQHISQENKADTKYEYMYTYKYAEETVPEGGEACFAKNLSKEIYGYNLEVTLLGIDKNNPYFDANVPVGKNKVIISSAMAQKYHLNTGDKLILTDRDNDMDYAFSIEGITQYSVGLYAFMDIDSMRDLLGQNDTYYNVVFSNHKLNIEAGRLYATTTKEEIGKSSDVFISKMMPLVSMLTGVSALIFCIVMYLMMKVMIDRSAYNISLMKIFGYRTGEIRKLYLNGNFYIIAVGAAIGIPLAKKMMDGIYPLLVSNIRCGMNLTFTWQLFLAIYLSIIILYIIINQLLVRRMKKIIPAEVLKNKE